MCKKQKSVRPLKQPGNPVALPAARPFPAKNNRRMAFLFSAGGAVTDRNRSARADGNVLWIRDTAGLLTSVSNPPGHLPGPQASGLSSRE